MAHHQRSVVLDRVGLNTLVSTLRDRGYRVIGPTLRDGAIVYAEVEAVDDLPASWSDEQDGGTYRLDRRDDEALLGYAVGPNSWKGFLYPPHTLLWRARRSEDGFEMEPDPEADEAPRYAFLGVRACELAAIAVQDRVFLPEGRTGQRHRVHEGDGKPSRGRQGSRPSRRGRPRGHAAGPGRRALSSRRRRRSGRREAPGRRRRQDPSVGSSRTARGRRAPCRRA